MTVICRIEVLAGGLIFALFSHMNNQNYKTFSLVGLMLSALLLHFSLPVYSAERDYVVAMTESKWLSTGKASYECSLSQMIPFYGEGKFIHKSGHELVFMLSSKTPMTSDVKVIVQSEPPAWRNDEVFEIGQFTFKQGKSPLRIDSPFASRMFQEVENGMSPLIIYRDLADGRDLISILLSPVRFRESYNEYLECEKTLVDFDIVEIKNLKIYFASNKASLSELSKRDLSNVKRYLAMDSSILQIKIDTYADSIGRRRYNDRLSESRSAAVKKFLLADGIKAEMIYAVNHGEREAAFNNKTAQGRSKNRRAELQLLTTAPPTLEEQQAMEKARKEELRKNLFDKSIFKGVPKLASSKKTTKAEEDEAANQALEQGPATDEPPAPNFINLDLLVKPYE